MVFINEYIIECSIYIWCTLSTWLIYFYYALKINKCCVCYLRTGYKKLLGNVRKIGRSVHTLIHPPSQCGCCVQQELGLLILLRLYLLHKHENLAFQRVHTQTSTLGCARLIGGSLGQLKTIAIVTSATSLLTSDLR